MLEILIVPLSSLVPEPVKYYIHAGTHEDFPCVFGFAYGLLELGKAVSIEMTEDNIFRVAEYISPTQSLEVTHELSKEIAETLAAIANEAGRLGNRKCGCDGHIYFKIVPKDD